MMTTLEMENRTTAMNHGTENLPELTATEILTETNPNGTAMDQTLPPPDPDLHSTPSACGKDSASHS
ncbi:hypothetical protein TNCV_3892901 [Trichonephila clavipes]|nr:hypothetical protein TNCV_3892901 [Trichonephila clavipes]